MKQIVKAKAVPYKPLTEADVDIILHRRSVRMPLDDHSAFEDSKG